MVESVIRLFQRFLPVILAGIAVGSVLIYIVFEDFTLPATLFFVAVFVGAMPLSTPKNNSSSVFGVWCFGLLSLLVSGTMALNYITNPLGIYSTNYFEPLVLNHDTTYLYKVKLYDDMRPVPEVVVLGSSRSFTVPPPYITQVTGLSAFNASVHGGDLDDFLQFTRHTIEQGHPPRALIIGLSTEMVTWHNANNANQNTSNRRSLIERVLGVNLSRDIRNARRIVSWDQTQEAIRMVKMEFTGRPAAFYSFDQYGQAHFNTKRSLEEEVQVYIAEPLWGKLFVNSNEINPNSVEKLTTLLTLCSDNNIQVIIYLPPFHPQMLEIYEQQNFLRLKTAYLDLLATLQSEYDFTFYDMTTLESFNGDATMFHDGVHPSEASARLILDIVLQDIPQD